MNELDRVALITPVPPERIWDIPSYSMLRSGDNSVEGLQPGDVGTIVCVQGGGKAFTVEFLQPGGYTVAIATLLPSQLRAASEEDLANDRFFNQTPE